MRRPDTDPFFNIAAEEFILKEHTEDVVMLWRNEPSVIVGKHQNAIREVNLPLIRKENIPVIRRISGGGTVYHDLNNLNYSVIRSVDRTDRMIDFRNFLKPVISFLGTLGLKAVFEGKNNLCIDGLKISGNAAHVYKNRVIHHGTLLFDSDLDFLNQIIYPPAYEIKDKAVESVRARVTNIKALLGEGGTLEKFMADFEEYLVKYYAISEISELNSKERNRIYDLSQNKYRKREWSFGYSPKYSFRINLSLNNQMTTLQMLVEKGLIKSINLSGENAMTAEVDKQLQQLIGVYHLPEVITGSVNNLAIDNKTKQQLIEKLI